jgi:HAD superfamily hydrolase (TIGR01493 family)
MGVMNSLEVWSAAASDERRGLAWRDAVTAKTTAQPSYTAYEDLVAEAAHELGLPNTASFDLFDRWPDMSPRPDAAAIARLTLPYAFVTNCSAALAAVAAERSALAPAFTLSAEEAGWYKPDARIYREACRRLGSEPPRTVFVAGSRYDGEGARRAGLRSMLILRRTDQGFPGPEIQVATSLQDVVAEVELQGQPRGR